MVGHAGLSGMLEAMHGSSVQYSVRLQTMMNCQTGAVAEAEQFAVSCLLLLFFSSRRKATSGSLKIPPLGPAMGERQAEEAGRKFQPRIARFFGY